LRCTQSTLFFSRFHSVALRLLACLQPQQSIPSIHIPLHTVIELTPRPDGTMGVEYIPVPIQLSDGGALGHSMDGHSIGHDVPQIPSALLQQQCQLQAQIAAAAAAGQCGGAVAVAVPAAAAAPAGAAEDAAVVIGDDVAMVSKAGEQQQREGSRASSESEDSFVAARDMQRMSSCSSSNTIAQMAAAAAVVRTANAS
jgi:hypothetical protein